VTLLPLPPNQVQHSLSTLCKRITVHHNFSSKIMQNTITASMIAETRKFKTSQGERFRLDQNALHVPMWLALPQWAPPILNVNQSVRASAAKRAFHRHHPPASPHGPVFLCHASRAVEFVSCGSISVLSSVVFSTAMCE